MPDCPRCLAPLGASTHPDVLRCATCGGHLVTPGAVPTLMQVASVNLALLPDLARAGRQLLACPACPSRQWQFPLKGVTVDACVQCGHLWLDGGELGKLTRGQWDDRPPVAPPPTPDRALTALGTHRSPTVMLDAFLADALWFRIKQRVERLEVFFGLQMSNHYVIDAPAGVGTAQESDTGILAALSRNFLRSMRKLDVTVFDAVNNPILSVTRPFYWLPFLPRTTTVSTFDGQHLGTIEQQFTILNNIYTLTDAGGRTWATVKRNLLGMGWTFVMTDDNGKEMARITKNWSGLVKESFTNADNFEVNLQPRAWTVPQKALVLCTALLMDFNHFENNQRRGSALNLLDG